jgi:hypothetical protein
LLLLAGVTYVPTDVIKPEEPPVLLATVDPAGPVPAGGAAAAAGVIATATMPEGV